MIIDFSEWVEYDEAHEGSGRSEKIWLKNPADLKVGLFKFKKDIATKDHVSEKIASDLGMILGIPCAQVDIGVYKGNEGSMSYLINQGDEELIEGISLINKIYPNYSAETMYDEVLQEHYSMRMLEEAVTEYGFLPELLQMLVFDFLIGNSDRHQNNWAILKKSSGQYSFSPLYDNSSSLCCYLLEEKVNGYLVGDAKRVNSIVSTKSLSIVRLDPKNRKRPRHEEVLKYIIQNHREKVDDVVANIKHRINEDSIETMLKKYPEELLSVERKQLLKLFLIEKVRLLKAITEGEEV